MNRRSKTPHHGQGDLISGEVPKIPTKDEVIASVADMAVGGAFEQAAHSHRQTDQTRAEGKEKQGEGETVQAIARGDLEASQPPQIDRATERWGQENKDKASGQHNANNPSNPSSRHRMSGDNANARKDQEDYRRQQVAQEPSSSQPLTPEEEDLLQVWG